MDELLNDDKSSGKVNFQELELQKQQLLDLIQLHMISHFNFESRFEISVPRFHDLSQSNMNSMISSDVKSILPQFQYKTERGSKHVEYIDFTLCVNKSKYELRNLYERQFKKHPKFLELMA